MKKLIYLSLSMLSILAACAPSEEAIQTAIAQTLTATPTASATVTATQQPTFTKTATPVAPYTSTLTPELTTTAAAESISGQAGWIDYTLDGFNISLPEEWKAVDIDKEGLAGILTLVEGLDNPLGKIIQDMISSGEMASMGMDGSIKFFARDPGTEASGNAMAAVINQSLPFPMGSSTLCMFLPAIFEKASLEVIDSRCGLEVNGVQGGMFETKAKFGETSYRQYLYFYLDGTDVWILLSGVEEAEWDKYAPIFTDIAESFEIGPVTAGQ